MDDRALIKDIQKANAKVEALLSEYEVLRDNDKQLWVAYLNRYCGLADKLRNAKDPWEAFKKVIYDPDTSFPESVTRARRKIQEEGRYRGKRREERKRNAQDVSDWAVGR